VLNVGASIRSSKIQPIYYGDIITQFNIDRIKARITFEAEDIAYKFSNGNIGIQPQSFSEESGKMIGMMRASGAGK